MSPTEPLFTARQLGEVLGLSTATVLDRFERGDLPGFRLFGRKGGPVRFKLSEIEETLASWRVEGPGTRGEAPATPSVLPTRGISYVMPATPQGGEEDEDDDDGA